MTDLADMIPSLKRAVAPPGEFDTIYTAATTEEMVGAIADGFAEAQLDGFFIASYGGAFALDLDTEEITPTLQPAHQALIVIYAAARMISTRLLNLKNRQKFAAKGADYEVEQSASILTALLKQSTDRITALRLKATYSGPAAAFHMADGYFLAATQRYSPAYDEGYTYSNSDPAGF